MSVIIRRAARLLALVAFLAAGPVATAQTHEETSAEPPPDEPYEDWTVDLSSTLSPGDNVGGSWNVALLYGRMTDASMVDVVLFNFDWAEATLLSADVGYTLKADNPVAKFLDPVVSTVDVAVNITYQDDPAGDIYVISPYIMARWSEFPWSNKLRTTFGLGGGLSYATDIPSIEYDPTDPNGDYSNLLHYIAIEATFALPQYKDWHLVYRLHHRSGVFGLMGADNEGNTAVQLGIRHYFK